MKKSFLSIFGASITCLTLASLTAEAAEPKKILIVTTTTGFRHSSIPTGEKVLAQIAQETGLFTLDFAQQPPNKPAAPRRPAAPKPEDSEAVKAKHKADLANFEEQVAKLKPAEAEWQAQLKQNLAKLSPENLKNYHAVVFANTTGDLPLPDRDAFLEWIKNGGGFVGMHSASDTFHGFRPFIEMLGGEFQSHGAQATVDCINQDPQHPACKHLGPIWTIHDEIYIMKSFNRAGVRGLLGLDKEPNKKTPGDYPVAWCKEYGKGKVFYTSLGHREDVWENPVYQKHILGGIKWVLGLEPGDATPQLR